MTNDGELIRQVQTALKCRGYVCPINGIYDNATYIAVVKFQEENGFEATGALDIHTTSELLLRKE